MAFPELQAFMDLHAAQMRDFLAAMMQQQQTAIEAMMNNERGRPAAQAQGINEKYYKRVESFTGEQAWRDWSFQFKSATKTANEAAYHLIETAEKEEKEIDDALSLTEEERSLSSGIFNILGTLVKGEPLQMLHTSGFSGFEAWRKLSKRYHDANEEHATHDDSHQLRQSERTRGGRDSHRQVGGQGLGNVTRFQRVAQ